MPILDSRFLFIHIPKTGGGSIEYAFGQRARAGWPRLLAQWSRFCTAVGRWSTARIANTLYGETAIVVTAQHLTLNEIVSLGLVPAETLYERLVCFTVVRNPFSRVISQWRSHERHIAYPDVNRFVSDWLFNGNLGKTHNDMAHSRPQSDFLKLDDFYTSGSSATPEVKILRFENLSEDFYQFVGKYFGRQAMAGYHLPHRHKSKVTHDDYRKLLNADSRGQISSFYREDLERFGYEW